MGELYVDEHERNALDRVDEGELDRLVSQAMRNRQIGDINRLSMTNCGPYVSGHFDTFLQAMISYAEAKSSKKIQETEDRARRSGSNLVAAVVAMKHRIKEELREDQLFHVDDDLLWPSSFGKRMSVRIYYRWRRTTDEGWQHGNITFTHEAVVRPNDWAPTPKRKPSAAKLREAEQEALSHEWESLMRTALHSVRAYFRAGRNGAEIPETFEAKADARDGLDNSSADFWGEREARSRRA